MYIQLRCQAGVVIMFTVCLLVVNCTPHIIQYTIIKDVGLGRCNYSAKI